METDYIRYQTERLELINKIKILSGAPSDLKFLEQKTISELMRIYSAGFDNHCARCGNEVRMHLMKPIYRSIAS